MDILVFGDIPGKDVSSHMHDLVFSESHHPLVSRFLRSVSSLLRQTISGLPSATKKGLPAFTNLREFINQCLIQEATDPAIEMVFLSILQLAEYIAFQEKEPSSYSQKRSIISVSYGLVAGVTAAIIPHGVAGIEVAAHAVQTTLKIALYIKSCANCLYLEAPSSQESWALNVFGLQKTDAHRLIHNFVQDLALPEPQRPYISAIWPTFITISGPPSTLRQLKTRLDSMVTVSDNPGHSFGPCHASHFHQSPCPDDFIDSEFLAAQGLNKQGPNTTVFSLSDGSPYRANSAQELYSMAITDILSSCQDFVSLIACHQEIFAQNSTDYRILSFGSTESKEPIVSTLQGFLGQRFTVPFDCYLRGLTTSGLRNSKSGKDSIAIVGMSGRFPGAENLDEFWKVISEGLDMHRQVPPDRFDVKTHCDESGKGHNKSHTPFGCFIDNPGLFDPRFFNMSPREAAQTDPMQRLALITAYEALEMAGYVPNRTPSTKSDRIGTFYGQTSDDWREINAAQEIDTYFITGGVRAFGPGRINYHFGFSGPSFSIDTACSSSMAAIHAACNALWLHDCDTAITGGMNVMTNPDIFSGLSKGQFLSRVGPCQTFDNDADGYCRGDAVATIILKRLADAEADHDNVLGIIRSVATNHSADAISITHPHAGTQEKLYRYVLSQAGVKPQDISYVEMHGTGTQAGDSTEMRSVTRVFAPSESRPKEKKLYVGSVKANVGHGEASSGVTALIKTLLMMRHDLIPPHVGIKKQLNKGFPDLAKRNIHIAHESIPWHAAPASRKVFVNNFSAAGGNTALVVTDGPSKSIKDGHVDPRSTQVIAVSARALSSLKKNMKALLYYLSAHPIVSLSSLSYTTTARRISHNYRFSIAASSIDAIKSALARAIESDISPVPQVPKIVFTFTGQGTMYPAVGSDLFHTNRVYRHSLIEFDSISISCGFPSIRALVNGSETRPVDEISAILLQVAQISIQMALIRVWESIGITPDYVLGHSLGEYAALFASGVLSAADTIYLVGSRARLMEMNCTVGTHAMLAIQGDNLSPDIIKTHRSNVACINSSNEFVLSGLKSDVAKFKDQLECLGLKTTHLAVPYAFHSSQVEIILAPFKDVCSKIVFHEPRCGVLSSTLGKCLGDISIEANYLSQHARQKVNFYGALCDAMSSGIIDDDTLFLEVGPSPVCNVFVKSTLGSSVTTCASLHRKKSSWEVIASSASELSNKGAIVDWGEYHREFEDSLELLELPSYGWTQSNYWIDYQNDWCLNKTATKTSSKLSEESTLLSTTSVHHVTREEFNESNNIVTAETDMSQPGIHALLKGHMVNNVALCPSSFYGDIGITLGTYMYRRMNPHSPNESLPGINVREMAVHKPLISGNTPHIINIDAKASSSKKNINITISSKEGEHASFVVEFCKESEWIDEWKRIGFLVESRIKSLRKQSQESGVNVLSQEVVYKLFAAFVDYDKTFQGMKRVYLDSLHCEATADIVLEAPSTDQSFNVPPYWIDSIGHLSGFILNAQLSDHDPKNVYVSHGWESLRLSKTLVPGTPYRTYVRMMERPGGNLVSGDVYCLEGSTVIAVFGGVTFMRIPRAVIDQVLPRPRSKDCRPTFPELRSPKSEQTNQSGSSMAHKVNQKADAPSLLSQVLTIIAQECGVDQNELADLINFADLGVDSLMQLAISSRIREELYLEIPSSLFIDYPTIGSLQSYVKSLACCEALEDTADTLSSTPTSNCENAPSSDSSVTENTTVSSEDIEIWKSDDLGGQLEDEQKDVSLRQSFAQIPVPSALVSSSFIPDKHASSFLLQGNPRTASKNLFLFPDGGGSATSYTHIPELSSDIAVYGLNSPFMTTPEEYTCGVSGIARYFLQEMRRRQGTGPYNIGGWSAGGVIAFEGAQQLLKSGEAVERLILIDAPCPLIIEPLPSTLHQWFNEIGLLGDGNSTKTPPWLLPHFQASINALSTYNFRPMDLKKAPPTHIIWCEDGVCKYPDDPRPDPYPYGHAQFLLESKTDFGPQLWDTLVDSSKINISTNPGNHLKMMKAPFAKELGNTLKKAFS